MKTWQVAALVVVASGIGFYLGTQYALYRVQGGVLEGVDGLLGKFGISPEGSVYGRVAHNIVDAGVGGLLGTGPTP